MRWFLITFLVIAGGYVFILLLLYAFQEKMLFLPSSNLHSDPGTFGMAYEDVYLETSDGPVIHAWWVPVSDAELTVLFFHGNAGNNADRLSTIQFFHRLGVNVLIVDYRGYGESEGSPTEQGLYNDAAAAWEYLTNERQIQPRRIVIFGRSLGGGVASWLAVNSEPAALILESSFTSIVDRAAELYPVFPVRSLSRFHMPVKQWLQEYEGPLVIVHSPQDEVIPYSHGRKLYELAVSEQKQFVEISGRHNDGMVISEDILREAYSTLFNRLREEVED